MLHSNRHNSPTNNNNNLNPNNWDSLVIMVYRPVIPTV